MSAFFLKYDLKYKICHRPKPTSVAAVKREKYLTL